MLTAVEEIKNILEPAIRGEKETIKCKGCGGTDIEYHQQCSRQGRVKADGSIEVFKLEALPYSYGEGDFAEIICNTCDATDGDTGLEWFRDEIRTCRPPQMEIRIGNRTLLKVCNDAKKELHPGEKLYTIIGDNEINKDSVTYNLADRIVDPGPEHNADNNFYRSVVSRVVMTREEQELLGSSNCEFVKYGKDNREYLNIVCNG